MKEQLASVDELVGMAVRAAVPRAVTAIERASRLEWLPIEVLLEVLDATLAALGPEEAAVHWRLSTLRSFDLPLIRPFVAGALELFNPSPAKVLLILPRLYGLLYRDTGSVAVENVEPGLMRIQHADVPAVMLASRGWSGSIGASYLATLDFLRARDARVDTTLELAAARVLFTLRWRPL